jgi:hypothetical protein
MENIAETKQLISQAKNVYIIPSEKEEAIVSALTLFYTLKELSKNVNLLLEKFPDNLKFLAPSLDFISYPKNFIISIPRKIAEVSQIYYEKNDDALKIHLSVENGIVKKDDISFYFSSAKPDLIITVGVNDYQEQLKNMDSFGFLLDSPILNIDNNSENKNFGEINIIKNNPLLSIVASLINNLR